MKEEWQWWHITHLCFLNTWQKLMMWKWKKSALIVVIPVNTSWRNATSLHALFPAIKFLLCDCKKFALLIYLILVIIEWISNRNQISRNIILITRSRPHPWRQHLPFAFSIVLSLTLWAMPLFSIFPAPSVFPPPISATTRLFAYL